MTMKTKSLVARLNRFCFTTPKGQILFGLCLCLGTLALLGSVTRSHQKGFVAHEWGTFTSVQGSDGVLLNWRPLESSRLPQFVYNWQNAGLNRRAYSAPTFTKSSMITLQRMETPVIYFYADEKQTVDVSVSFPKGLITEWYPQASQIGPSTIPASALVTKADALAHKVGAKPEFTFSSFSKNHAARESRARWANVEILPTKDSAEAARSLRQDRSGSHYFAARDTDSSLIRVDSLNPTNPEPESEKFIFYRGAGNFTTPLLVTMQADGIAISNTGPDALEHLFVLGLENGTGKFIPVQRLAPGEKQIIHIDLSDGVLPTKALSEQIGQSIATALVSQGLYEREAQAMVNTWRDSWFEEDGLRVLYVLPRQWTDQTLPLNFTPKPRELVRVMVGRAEVITPKVQLQLSIMLTRAQQGDTEARQQALAEFKTLGRFAEPALWLATKNSPSQVSQAAWNLYQSAAQSAANKSL